MIKQFMTPPILTVEGSNCYTLDLFFDELKKYSKEDWFGTTANQLFIVCLNTLKDRASLARIRTDPTYIALTPEGNSRTITCPKDRTRAGLAQSIQKED